MAQKKSQYSWQYNKMMALVRGLDFKTIDEYFAYCADSWHNGRIKQCRSLFSDMPKIYRHELIDYLKDHWADDEMHNFFVKLF